MTSRSHHTAVAGVLELVAANQGLDVDELARPTRGSPAAAAARQVAMYLCVVDLEMSRKQVARAIGRDRTTVGHAVTRVEDRRDDPKFEAAIAALEQRLIGGERPPCLSGVG